MIKILLWDIDGTLLNFLAAEKVAIRKGFKRLEIGECTDEMLADYSAMNKRVWTMIEKGEIVKAEALVRRFELFFEKYGIDSGLAAEFNENYQIDLGDTICFNDDAYEIVKGFKGKYKQYAATNGTVTAQSKKLKDSGLGLLLDGCFISDEIGYEKPSKEFFDIAINKIREENGPVKEEEILIIGDSLTSDITGGNRAGIKTCWYNLYHEINNQGVVPDFEIDNLQKVMDLLK